MLLDADDLEHEAGRDCEICIAGAGAAGIALALELAARGSEVCLLEGGGLELEEASQELYAGVAEPPLQDDYLIGSRLRYLGGTTNHWLGYCRPFEEWDFDVRPWFPHSGWPITRQDLDPYYERAAAVLELPGRLPSDRPLIDASTNLVVGSFHRNPLRFRKRYLANLTNERRIELLLHASAVHLALTPSGRAVAHLEVATAGGRRLEVRARRYVLALGAIENARLLLVSADVQRDGVGNERDLVGRYFMDHPVFTRIARIATRATSGPFHVRPPASAFETCLVDRPGQESNGTGGCSLGVDLLPEPSGVAGGGLAGVAAPSLDRHLAETGAALGRQSREVPGLRTKTLDARPEPAPDPDSRVLLDSELDVYDKPKVRLRLRQTPLDGRTAARALELLATALGRHALGRLWIDPQIAQWRVEQGYHHAGTTRMHDDPARGVVDRHCRVHGVENLFVAGGSVFPTAGAVNPTFTIVALTLRLADHLRSGGQ